MAKMTNPVGFVCRVTKDKHAKKLERSWRRHALLEETILSEIPRPRLNPAQVRWAEAVAGSNAWKISKKCGRLKKIKSLAHYAASPIAYDVLFCAWGRFKFKGSTTPKARKELGNNLFGYASHPKKSAAAKRLTTTEVAAFHRTLCVPRSE